MEQPWLSKEAKECEMTEYKGIVDQTRGFLSSASSVNISLRLLNTQSDSPAYLYHLVVDPN